MNEFDEYARDYHKSMDHIGRRIVDRDGNYFIQVKCQKLIELLGSDNAPVGVWRIIDVGCGTGDAEKSIPIGFANITAIDLSFEMIKIASRFNSPVLARYLQADAVKIPLPDAYADLVFASCVFHHMEEGKIMSALREMRRVCKPGGWVVCFEHNPYHPLTQLVVRTTPIDRSAHLHPLKKMSIYFSAAGLLNQFHHYFLYAPKSIDKALWPMLRKISHLPFGGQYILAGHPF